RLLLRELEPLAQRRVRRRRVFGLADDPDDLVDIVDGDLQAFQDVLPVLGALQLELRAARDDGVAVLDEVLQQLLQVHLLRPAVHQREHDGAEGHLHLRVPVQLIQDGERHPGGGEWVRFPSLRRSFTAALGWWTRWWSASAVSGRWWGGRLVAARAAIPAEPVTIRLGSRAGSTVGSWSRSSKFGTKSTV